jgi:hypothetical protein
MPRIFLVNQGTQLQIGLISFMHHAQAICARARDAGQLALSDNRQSDVMINPAKAD